MKPTYEHDEAKRLRVLYNQLLSYKDDFVLKVMVQKLTHEQRLEAGIEVIKLTGEIKRLDWFIGHLLFGWEKEQENDGLSIFDLVELATRFDRNKKIYRLERELEALQLSHRGRQTEMGFTKRLNVVMNRRTEKELRQNLNIN